MKRLNQEKRGTNSPLYFSLTDSMPLKKRYLKKFCVEIDGSKTSTVMEFSTVSNPILLDKVPSCTSLTENKLANIVRETCPVRQQPEEQEKVTDSEQPALIKEEKPSRLSSDEHCDDLGNSSSSLPLVCESDRSNVDCPSLVASGGSTSPSRRASDPRLVNSAASLSPVCRATTASFVTANMAVTQTQGSETHSGTPGKKKVRLKCCSVQYKDVDICQKCLQFCWWYSEWNYVRFSYLLGVFEKATSEFTPLNG